MALKLRAITSPVHTLCVNIKSLIYTTWHRLTPSHDEEIAELRREFKTMSEHLETLIRSKERLLQDISHELRSPLTRLQIAMELARKKCNLLAKNEFHRMEIECLHLNDLISEALEFARLDQPNNKLKLSLVHLPQLIQLIVEDTNYEFSQKTPRVITDILHPCQLMLDERLIHRAIENILRNALRYSPEPLLVVISIDTQSSPEWVYINIADQGPGISEEHLNKIFNPFYRVDVAREKKTGGYGLGLAIAKRAIQLHEGEIQAINRKEGGLLVQISLPKNSSLS